MALRYRSSRESCSSRSSLSCLHRRKISLRIFTSKLSPLASAKTSFLPSFSAAISSSMCSTRSMNERMRSPGIPAASVMPVPYFKRSYGTATKVTEKLASGRLYADALQLSEGAHPGQHLAIALPGGGEGSCSDHLILLIHDRCDVQILMGIDAANNATWAFG
jgi:hypothetical protein